MDNDQINNDETENQVITVQTEECSQNESVQPEENTKKRKIFKRKDKKRKSIVISIFNRIIIILVLVLLILVAWYFIKNKKSSSPSENPLVKTEKSAVLIREQLSYWQEFVTFKYRYSSIGTVKKSGFITSSYSMVKFYGIIRVGIADITECEINLSEDGNRLEITLPPLEILGNEISSQEVFDEHRNIFIPIKTEEIFQQIEEKKKEAEEDMLSDGLMDSAKEYAVKILTQVFTTAGFEEVIVK